MHRFFRLLIRTYPRAFRERWQNDLVGFHDEALAGARAAGGAFWRTRFWARTVADVVVAGLRLRAPPASARRQPMGTLWSEWVAAWRGLRRAPGFHVVAALTLGLGVAGTTAVFGVLDGVVLRALPYPDAGRLVQVASRIRMNPGDPGPMSHPDVLLLRERSRSLEAIAAVEVRTRVIVADGEPELAGSGAASEGLLGLLGAQAAAGRLFDPSDFTADAPDVIVLANETWRTRYGGSADVVGETIRVDDRPHVVIGALGAGFVPPEAVEADGVAYWTNLRLDPDAKGAYGAGAIGRLRPGVTPAAAEVEITGLLQEGYRDDGPVFLSGGFVRGLQEATVGAIGGTLWLLLCGVGLLLAIACANVANLMLARGTDRRGEAVMRIVLGASRGRIAMQLLMQSLVVAVAGAAAGTGLAWGALALFRRFGPGGVPRLAEVTLDGRVLAFSTAIAALTGLLFGLLPALQAAGRAPADVLREAGRSHTGRSRARGALVVGETAMALVLVLVSGLLLNGFLRLRSVDPGFRMEGLITLDVELRARGFDADATTAFQQRLLERVRGTPGVRSAALSTFTPFRGFSIVQRYTVDQSVFGADDPEASFIPSFIVSDGMMETMGTRIVAGRDFDDRDGANGEPVVLVSEALARAHWPGASEVVGRRIKSGGLEIEDEPWYTVIGVVSDVRAQAANDPAIAIYHPVRQEPWRRISVLVRADGPATGVIPVLRAAVRDVDPAVPIRMLAPVADLARESLARPRFYTVLVAGFGALALLLALVGIYGTTAYAMSRRTREIGVRLALGGNPGTVTRLLVRDGARLAMAGVALGLVVSLAGARLLEAYLFGVEPTDPPTFVVTALAVIGTAVLAAWIPARRAARLDPSTALRTDEAGGHA